MRLSIHSKVSIFVSLLTILSAFMLSGLFFRGVPAHAAGAPNFGATKGILTPSTTVDSNQQPIQALSRGTRPIKPMGNASQGAHLSEAGLATLDTGAGALRSNFNGVSSLDSARTNFGAEFEPPDQGLCAGNGFVVEPVNSAYTIYRRDGSVVAGPFNVNRLFDEGFKQFTSDPRCYFDKSTNTWFAIILFINATGTRARTDVAVNPTGDPTTPWTVYHIDATDDGTNGTPNHAGCPCLGDQPLLGIDHNNVYISTNEFSILGTAFNGAQIYAISKSQLVALSKSVNFVHFDNLSIGGAIATSVQPAITNGTPRAEYFMNSLDPNGTFDNRLGVWAITNQNAVSMGDIPNLSSVVITSEPYGVPPGAIQQGATSLLDSGDDRMQQVQFINGSLWGALDTAVTIPNDPASRAGAAWFNVTPHLNGAVIGGANINKQGYVALNGNYLLYPAIQASSQGTAAIVMTLSGPTFFPSAVYTVLQQGQKSFGTVHVAAPGTGNYSPQSTRWGDYSWAIIDPNGKSFWMATEYIPPLSSQTPDGLQNWGTRVLQIGANG
jgi:hypothetical protein